MDLRGKVVVVTGGGQGLGRQMALRFAAKGAHLALIDLDQAKLDETLGQIAKVNPEVKAKSYIANVAQETEVESSFSNISADFGKLDVLVNNAGVTRDGLLVKAKNGQIQQKMSLEQWRQVIDVNLTGVFLCTREAVCQMIAQDTQGVIINISSISRHGNLGQTNYTASKAGVAGMTVTWAKELAHYGIRVGAVAPGFIETDMTAGMKPEALEKICSVIPAKRMGKPDEIAHSVEYIIENDYFNGRVIECDGGLRI